MSDDTGLGNEICGLGGSNQDLVVISLVNSKYKVNL